MRLIDANSFSNGWMLAKFTEYNGRMRLIKTMQLQDVPTVDAVEVVHGRWENVQETEMYVPDMKLTITKTAETCSECKARIGFVGAKQYLFDTLCPNCGAKMDLEVSDGKA